MEILFCVQPRNKHYEDGQVIGQRKDHGHWITDFKDIKPTPAYAPQVWKDHQKDSFEEHGGCDSFWGWMDLTVHGALVIEGPAPKIFKYWDLLPENKVKDLRNKDLLVKVERE